MNNKGLKIGLVIALLVIAVLAGAYGRELMTSLNSPSVSSNQTCYTTTDVATRTGGGMCTVRTIIHRVCVSPIPGTNLQEIVSDDMEEVAWETTEGSSDCLPGGSYDGIPDEVEGFRDDPIAE